MRLPKLLTAAVQIDAVPKPNSMSGIPNFPENFFDINVPTGPNRIIAM